MKPNSFACTVLFVIITLSSSVAQRTLPSNSSLPPDVAVTRFVRRGDPDILPSHYWRLAKTQDEIEAFRARYNLTIVSAEPQDAALLPSWPQALLQYLLINPIINISSNGIGCWDIAQYISLPPCFIAWIVSFARIQSNEKTTAGWISIIGWASWLCLISDLPRASGVYVVGLPSLIFAFFQWCASLTVIIQRWTKDIGTVAYLVTDLHGCTPSEGGLEFLQAGVRAYPYRVIQTTTFVVVTVYASFCGMAGSKAAINAGISTVGLAELIYSSVVANRGMPMVVSGSCMLVELSPKVGYLDSSISTSWKALSGFMGF